MQYTLLWLSFEGVDHAEGFNSIGDVFNRMNFLHESRMMRVGYYVVNF
jgi:hypothetical protein